MDTIFSERLEASFVGEPAHRPVEERIMDGRRVVRNRRIAVAAGGLAVVAALGAGTLFLPQTINAADVATNPIDRSSQTSATPEPYDVALTEALPVDESWRSGCGAAGQPTCEALLARIGIVRYLSDGTLVRSTPDVVVRQRVDDPAAMETRGQDSVALEAELNGTLGWWMASWSPDRTRVWVADPSGAGTDFTFWSEHTLGREVVAGEPKLTELPGR